MKMILCVLSVAAWLAIQVADASGAKADDPTERLAEQWIEYFQSIKSLQCNNELSSKRTGDLNAPDTTTRVLSSRIERFHWERSGRLAIRGEATGSDGRQIPSEVVFDGNRFLSGGIDPQATPSVVSLLKTSVDSPDILGEVPAHLCCLLGIHIREFSQKKEGMIPLIKLLRQREKLRGVDEQSFVWVGERYKILFEADTSRGFAPIRVEYRLLKNPAASEPRVVTMKSAEFSDWEDFGGIWFPTHSIEQRELSEGIDWDGERKPASRTVTESRLSLIELNNDIPDSAYAFQLPIPDYTPVQMLDAEQLGFYWLNGEVVPATDETAAKIALDAAASRLADTGRWQKYLWIVGGLSACLALAVLYARLRPGS